MAKKQQEQKDAESPSSTQVRRREVKFEEKEEFLELSPRKCYHCFLLKRNQDKSCEGAKFTSGNVWKHIQSKKHYGPEYQSNNGIPEGIEECLGKECDHCIEIPDLESKYHESLT